MHGRPHARARAGARARSLAPARTRGVARRARAAVVLSLPVDDAALLQAWAEGDQAAGEALFERHFAAIARFFAHKVASSALADDLVQQTFLGVVQARDRFRAEAAFRTFLFAIARNVLHKHYRGRAIDRGRVDIPDVGETSLAALDPSPSAVLAADRADVELVHALRELPLDLQLVLELHYWEGMGVVELAAVVDAPVGTVKTRLRRARQLVEAAIERRRASGRLPPHTQTRLREWASDVRARVDAVAGADSGADAGPDPASIALDDLRGEGGAIHGRGVGYRRDA